MSTGTFSTGAVRHQHFTYSYCSLYRAGSTAEGFVFHFLSCVLPLMVQTLGTFLGWNHQWDRKLCMKGQTNGIAMPYKKKFTWLRKITWLSDSVFPPITTVTLSLTLCTCSDGLAGCARLTWPCSIKKARTALFPVEVSFFLNATHFLSFRCYISLSL